MITFDQTIHIARTPEEVFEFLADLENLPIWQKGLSHSVVLTPGALHVGSEFEETVKIAGRSTKLHCEITALEPGRVLAYRSQKGSAMEYSGRFDLQPGDGGTELRMAHETTLYGMFRLLERIFSREVASESTRELAYLKAYLEGKGGQV